MGRSSTVVLGLSAVLLSACASAGGGPASRVTLYQGARIIVGDGTVIEEGALLVDGDRIRRVGSVGELTAPAGAGTVDLTGKTVIPALIDAHAHLGYEGFTAWGAGEYDQANVIDHLYRYAYYGFGAVLSAGTDPEDLMLGLQRDQRLGRVGGARVLFAAGMAPPGEGPNNQFLEHALTVSRWTGMPVLRGVSSPDDARAEVRQAAAKGIRFVKIWVDDRGGTQTKLQPIVYRALVREARARGLDVLVHQQTADDMPELLDAGVSGFLHGRIGPDLDAELTRRVRRAGAFLVPNLGLGELRRERVADDPFLQETIPPSVVARLREAYDAGQRPAADGTGAAERERALREGFSRLLQADVDIVLGTDAGALPDHFFGYTGHRELEIFVRLGMSPMQAIVAATSHPAEHLGLTSLGTLAAGKSADFVVLDDNPLEDIRNTRAIDSVFLRGVEVRRAALARGWREGD